MEVVTAIQKMHEKESFTTYVQIYLAHIRALISLFQIITDKCTHILPKQHFINSKSVRHVSALKGLSVHLMTHVELATEMC
jgi:hypothetical protein